MTKPQISPEYVTIGELFQLNYIFRVPKYQRGYAWGDSQVDDFLSDLWKVYTDRVAGQPRHHLFGGVLSAEGESPGSARRRCELIDGQQRLATFIIFVSHLVKAYEGLSTGSNQVNSQLASSRAARLTNKYLEYDHEVNRKPVREDRFKLSDRDQQFFKDLTSENSPVPTRDSHEKLQYAFNTIGDRLQQELARNHTVRKKLDVLEKFENALDEDCTLIHILTDSREEAYRLFQVLNDRGMSLTEGDLLRARTLEMLSASDFREQQQTVESSWNDILIDPPEFTKDFLMWFYASVKGKRPMKTALFDNFVEGFFPEHSKRKLSRADAKRVVGTVHQLQKEIVTCRKLNEGEWPYPHANPVKQWDRDRLNLLINALEHKLCMPLLLSAASELDQKRFSALVQLVERFAFRYKNISNQHVGSLTKLYHEHAVAIRKKPSTYKVGKFRDDLRNLQAGKVPDAFFLSSFDNLKYSPSAGNKTLKYFLLSAEYFLQWFRNGANGDPKCTDKSRVFEFTNTAIEHIYPLSAEASARDSDLELLKNDLGNLTFLDPNENDRLGNKGFATKKPMLASSSIMLNREISSKTVWDVAAVKVRQADLQQLALKVFTL
jgi:hypothetical protein